MLQTYLKLTGGLVFAFLCGSLSPARAEEPTFDVLPQIELANTRLELAAHPPEKYKVTVARNLLQIRSSWRKNSAECLNPAVAPQNLVATKTYLRGILKRITDTSRITALLATPYGVCVTPIEQPGGMFAFLDGPRLSLGVINIPPKFLQELGNEDELAFVLAHELSHFLLKDEIFFAYVQGTNRPNDEVEIDAEREADELAMRLIINAGYDVNIAMTRVKELRGQDNSHFVASQMDDMRDIVLTDLKLSGKSYAPVQSAPYLPAQVLREINAYLNPQTSASGN
jgi:hypothetical protein